jgi:predicted Zn finger-like uncharacterized protein
MITFLCSNCGTQLRVKDEQAGRTGRCPRCGHAVESPSEGSLPFIPTVKPDAPPAVNTPTPTTGKRDTESTKRLAARGTDPSRPVFEAQTNVAPEDLAFLAPPEATGEIGRMGSWRILKILGAGGMGIVFLAEDIKLKRQVAIKALKAAMAVNAEHRERFTREAAAAAAVEHDYVVPIYQIGEERGIPFLAMKLLQGESLEDRLNRVGRLPLDDVLRIGQEIAEGLAAAHARGLIHRDIKPANVWLEEGRDRVKIVDFGLARARGDDSRLTQTGYMLGTPSYMPPEQANGDAVDTRSDLFSLGCVLYRMCTGELPFKGRTTLAVLTALATSDPKPPIELNPNLPPALSDLVMRLLNKLPEDRPASAREVAETLEELRREPLPTQPDDLDVVTDLDVVEDSKILAIDDLKGLKDESVIETRPRRRKRERRDEEEPELLQADDEEIQEELPRRGRKRHREDEEDEEAEGQLEWKVIRLAILVGVLVLLLLAFLVVRMILRKQKPADAPEARAVQSLGVCRRTVKMWPATSSSSPSWSRATWTGRPLTQVPLTLPRSSTTT